MVHYYVYTKQPNGDVYYECTCGTAKGADDRVKELEKRGKVAWHQTTSYPGAFY